LLLLELLPPQPAEATTVAAASASTNLVRELLTTAPLLRGGTAHARRRCNSYAIGCRA
jgi:hypothetical protein